MTIIFQNNKTEMSSEVNAKDTLMRIKPNVISVYNEEIFFEGNRDGHGAYVNEQEDQPNNAESWF